MDAAAAPDRYRVPVANTPGSLAVKAAHVVARELTERPRQPAGHRLHDVGRRLLVTCPVLLLTRVGCASYDPEHGRYLEAHLREATLREVQDPNDAWFIGHVPWVVEQVDRFVELR